MKRVLKPFFLAAATVTLLGGCASMTPEECLSADWYQQGLHDGGRGQSMALVEEHREACAKVGVEVDINRYRAGREEGLRTYCTPSVGFDEGLRGRYYSNVCAPALERTFLDSYRQGRRIYEAQQRVDSLKNDLNSKQYALERAKDDDSRARIRRQMRDLDDSLRRARDDLYYAERAARDYRSY
ncbi:MAG: DUF2799 domain-containing protein [Alcaligenaceae bacterium]|nr:DUF2799 domain-containing protein [Alcaligenaceae bacterium]